MATKAPEVILIDTNVLIDYLDEVPEIVAELDSLATKRLAISIVTELEILFGMFKFEQVRAHSPRQRNRHEGGLIDVGLFKSPQTAGLLHRCYCPLQQRPTFHLEPEGF